MAVGVKRIIKMAALTGVMAVTAVGSAPARASHDHDIIGPVAAFIALGALLHHGHHRRHEHRGYHGHYQQHHRHHRRHSYSHGHGGYRAQGPRYGHGHGPRHGHGHKHAYRKY